MFRLASARYAANMQEANADVDKVQNAWLEELRQFVDEHRHAPMRPRRCCRWASPMSFPAKSGRRSIAMPPSPRTSRFGFRPQGSRRSATARKAPASRWSFPARACRRQARVRTVAARGCPYFVHYWATWCEPCKVDIAEIRELYAKYGPKKFQVVGVVLDSDKDQLAKFFAAKPIRAPQMHEAGGLDGRLAEELGVLTLPTMILVDADGKVADRNLVITDLERKLDTMIGGKSAARIGFARWGAVRYRPDHRPAV